MNKAEMGSEIILWITIIVVTIIAGTWFVNRLSPATATQDRIETDLFAMQDGVSIACSSDAYTKHYNPLTEAGTLFTRAETPHVLCMNTTDLNACTNLSCDVQPFQLDLSSITQITITKNQQGVTIT